MAKETSIAQQRALKAFADQHPEFFSMALAVIKAWGDSGLQLQHVLGVALREMYEAGKAGETPPADDYARLADSLSRIAINCKSAPDPVVPKRIARSRRA